MKKQTNISNLNQSLIELMADFLETQEVKLEISLSNLNISEIDSENLHIAMAEAAMETLVSVSKIKNRIWTDGEGLSWSTITELLGEDEETPNRLQKCTLDLTDHLFIKLKEHGVLRLELSEVEEEISFLKGNIGSCYKFGIKRLNYDEGLVKYIHDTEPKIVSIKVVDDNLEVKEEKLTMICTS